MRKKLLLIIAIPLIAIVATISLTRLPLFSKEICTMTFAGGWDPSLVKATLYSNRLLLVDDKTSIPDSSSELKHQQTANILLSKRIRISKELYEFILELLAEIEMEEDHATFEDATAAWDVSVYCLRYNGNYYYSSLSADIPFDEVRRIMDLYIYVFTH
jgi:hypothetical protein